MHFGLGATRAAPQVVRVRWCGGEEREYHLAANRYHRLEQ
jgi:hypothetical protein